VVDRLVAVVNGRAVTQSELELEVRIELLRQRPDAPEEAGRRTAADVLRMPLTPAELRPALNYAIALRLANDEADKLHSAPVDEAEVERSFQNLVARAGGAKGLAELLAREDTDVTQIRAILARTLRATSVLNSRVRLKAQVSETDVRSFFEEHPELGADGGFDTARAGIREALLQQRYTELIAQEIAQARHAGDVRLVAPWAREEGSEAP
jgi:DNA-binding transcriptional regulator YdaS (Cro superfamily)